MCIEKHLFVCRILVALLLGGRERIENFSLMEVAVTSL
jgi:hypothetical protein